MLRGRRHRHAGRARARRRPPDRLAGGPRRGGRGADGVAAGRAGRRRRSPTRCVGDVSPGGKLPISYPRSSGQIPIFYGHKVSGGRSHWKGAYVDLSNEPLYPFGHGLVVLDVRDRRRARSTAGRRSGRRHGRRGGHRHQHRRRDAPTRWCSSTRRDPVASITRPVRELQGFARVDARARRRGPRHVPRAVAALGFTGRDLRYVVEPGDIELLRRQRRPSTPIRRAASWSPGHDVAAGDQTCRQSDGERSSVERPRRGGTGANWAGNVTFAATGVARPRIGRPRCNRSSPTPPGGANACTRSAPRHSFTAVVDTDGVSGRHRHARPRGGPSTRRRRRSPSAPASATPSWRRTSTSEGGRSTTCRRCRT